MPDFRVQPKIFSRAGFPFRDSRQNGIHNVSGILNREAEFGDHERFEVVLVGGEVDRVFFSCQEPARLPVAAGADKGANVVQVISMMVAKNNFRRGRDSGGAYLGKELFGARDATEDDGRGWRVRENELALDSPDRLLPQRRMIHRQACGQYDCVRACER